MHHALSLARYLIDLRGLVKLKTVHGRETAHCLGSIEKPAYYSPRRELCNGTDQLQQSNNFVA